MHTYKHIDWHRKKAYNPKSDEKKAMENCKLDKINSSKDFHDLLIERNMILAFEALTGHEHRKVLPSLFYFYWFSLWHID